MKTIYYLGQTHNTINEKDDASFAILERIMAVPTEAQFHPSLRGQFNSVVKSQFEIYQFIKAHPDIPVFIENGKVHKHDTNSPEAHIFKNVFPKGVPNKFSQLTFHQKKCFFSFSGVQLAVFGRTIDIHHGDFEFNLELTQLDKHDKKSTSIYQKREFNTLYEISKKTTELGKDEAILVYGNDHSFEDVATCFPELKMVKIESSSAVINKDWTEQDEKNYQEHYWYTRTPRPELNCTQLQLELSSYGVSLADSSRFVSTPTQSANMVSSYAANLLVLPLLAFGLFKCCRRKHTAHNARNLTENHGMEEASLSAKAKSQ